MRFGTSQELPKVFRHKISSWSVEKWQRYGTCSVSQGRRGPSNWVSKINFLKPGGHSFLPRKLIFGYIVAQCIYPKPYYYPLLIKSSVWPWQGLKDDQSGPKYRVLLYLVSVGWILQPVKVKHFFGYSPKCLKLTISTFGSLQGCHSVGFGILTWNQSPFKALTE